MGDKPALHPGEPVAAALIAIAHDILSQAEAALTDMDGGKALAVHDYRKAMKRWRAFLRLIEPFLPPEDRLLRNKARDLARQLTGTRDIQAVLDALTDLEKSELDLSKTPLARMRDRVEQAKQAAETTTLTSELRGELQAALASAAQAVEAWALEHISFRDIAGAVAHNYGRARRAIPAAWPQATAEELHELRKRVVEHRYQMELVEPLWQRLGKLWVAEAQRLRERLGSHQDLVLLSRLTAPHQLLAHWRSRIGPLIDQRKAAHVAAAQRFAQHLFAERPKAFRQRIEALWKVHSG